MMPRGLAYVIAGIMAGFGVLFLTIWSQSPDAMTMVAVMFACASVMISTARAPKAKTHRDSSRNQSN